MESKIDNNTTILTYSFVGDAVHTLFVREKIAKENPFKVGKLSSLSSKFCNAKAQELAFFKIKGILTDEELAIAKRARNANIKHSAKNFTIEEYRNATAFEAVLGFLYLNGKNERMNTLLDLSTKE